MTLDSKPNDAFEELIKQSVSNLIGSSGLIMDG
jgi:hypothetical protein